MVALPDWAGQQETTLRDLIEADLLRAPLHIERDYKGSHLTANWSVKRCSWNATAEALLMKAAPNPPKTTTFSLAQLLAEQPSAPSPGWIEPGLLPPQGILFVGGEPKVGKSLLVANLALSLAAGKDQALLHRSRGQPRA